MLISRAKPTLCLVVAALWLLLSFLARNAPQVDVAPVAAVVSFGMIFIVLGSVVLFTASAVRLPEFPEDGPLDRLRRVFAADFPRQGGKGVIPAQRAVKAGLLAGLAMTLTGLLLSSVFSHLARLAGHELPQQDVANAFVGGGLALRCVLFVILVVITPFVEELFFRYAMAHTLAGAARSQRVGEVATALLFALMHANLVAFLPLVVVSLCCSAVYRKTGSFLAPVVAHSFFNLVSVILLLFS